MAVFVDKTQPGAPGAFYELPSSLPESPPGTIIRSEVIDGFRSGATAYRVRYESTGRDSHADTIVAPVITARLADRLCAEGESVELRMLAGVGRLQTGHVAAPDVVRRIGDRFAGKPPPTTLPLERVVPSAWSVD